MKNKSKNNTNSNHHPKDVKAKTASKFCETNQKCLQNQQEKKIWNYWRKKQKKSAKKHRDRSDRIPG